MICLDFDYHSVSSSLGKTRPDLNIHRIDLRETCGALVKGCYEFAPAEGLGGPRDRLATALTFTVGAADRLERVEEHESYEGKSA